MDYEKGRVCQVCGRVVSRRTHGFSTDAIYRNQCKSCGQAVHELCAEQLRDDRVAGNFWICDCGKGRNNINSCDGWSKFD